MGATSVLLGAFCLHTVVGSIYNYALITIYVSSYWLAKGLPYTVDTISTLYFIAVMFMSMFMVLGDLAQRHLTHRTCAIVFGGGIGVSLMLSSFTIQIGIIPFAITYSIMHAVFLSVFFSTALSYCRLYFKANIGVVCGLCLCCTALVPVFYGPLISYIVNPSSLAPDYIPTIVKTSSLYFSADTGIPRRVPTMLRALGMMYTSFAVLGGILLPPLPPRLEEPRPSKRGELMDDVSDASKGSVRGRGGVLVAASFEDWESELKLLVEQTTQRHQSWYNTIGRHLKDNTFRLLWVHCFLNTIYSNYLTGYWKVTGSMYFTVSDTALMTYGAGIAAISNSIGRPLIGLFMDRVGYKKAMMISNTSIMILFGIMSICTGIFKEQIKERRSLFMLWLALAMFFFSGYMTGYAASIAMAFSPEDYASVYGLMYSSRVAGTVLLICILRFHATIGEAWLSAILVVTTGLATLALPFARNTYMSAIPPHRPADLSSVETDTDDWYEDLRKGVRL